MALNHQFQVVGNLGDDAVLSRTPNQTPVVEMSVGISERKKNEDGEWEAATTWIPLTWYGKRAESLHASGALKKGNKVACQGRIAKDTWETQSGENRSKFRFILDDIELMSKASAN